MIGQLAYILLLISQIAGFIAIFFTSIGTMIMFLGILVFAWMTHFSIITWKYLGILFVLYLIGECLEFLTTIIGAKGFGASNKAALGAMIGGFLGAVLGTLFFGFGIFLGTLIGIFLGALLVDLWIYKDIFRSIKAGTGGVLGRIGAIFCKVIIAVVMWVVVGSAIF